MATLKQNLVTTMFINLLNDWSFKRLFGSKERSNILKRFLNALFEGKMVIETVTFEDKEVLPDTKFGKRLFYDVHCTTNTGHSFVVEMQRLFVEGFDKRILFYSAAAIYKQGVKGSGYTFDPVYTVVVCDFDMPQCTPRLINSVMLCESDTNIIFSHDLQIIFISLRQLPREWDECSTEIERLLFLIKNMDKMDKNSKPYKSGEYKDIFDASEVSMMANEDVVEYAKAQLRAEETMLAVKEAKATGFEEGREEGIELGFEQGIKRNKVATAEKLLIAGMPEDFVESITGLSRETIREINSKLY